MLTRWKKTFVAGFAVAILTGAGVTGFPALDTDAKLTAGTLEYQDYIIVEWCATDCWEGVDDCCITPE